MAETYEFEQIQQILETLSQIQASFRQLPVITTADGDKFVQVDSGGTGLTLATFNAAAINVAEEGRLITAGTGLSGGGSLAADRTINLDVDELTAIADVNISLSDEIPAYDKSASVHRKYTLQQALNLLGSLSTLTSLDTNDKLVVYDNSAELPKLINHTSFVASNTPYFSLAFYTSTRNGANGITIPANLIGYIIIATGGGGGGGRAVSVAGTGAAATYAAGGGGGSGGTSLRYATRAECVAADNTSNLLDIIIGAGGGGATTQNAGGSGGATYVGTLAAKLVEANGGGGGVTGSSSFGRGGAAAAVSSIGTVRISGGVGDYGGQPRASAEVMGGKGAASFWGGGNRSTVTASGGVAGPIGNAPGAGGGGGVSFTNATSRNGGSGASGMVVLLGLLTV